MYQRIVLAYDGSLEGRGALREGAILARQCGARVFLLSVVNETPGLRMADGANPGATAAVVEQYKPVLDDGLARLKKLGFQPSGKLVLGVPAQMIGAYAKEVGADLVIVGHRRPTFMERWWTGSTGANLMDHIRCSLLISRSMISEETFLAELTKYAETQA